MGNMLGSALGGSVGGAALWMYDEIIAEAKQLFEHWFDAQSKAVGSWEVNGEKIVESFVKSAFSFSQISG